MENNINRSHPKMNGQNDRQDESLASQAHHQAGHCLLTNVILSPEYYTGLLMFRAVADPRNSGISAKSREIPKKTRNTAKFARNISKYLSAKHI